MKVHFAGSEGQHAYLIRAGVRYRLASFYALQKERKVVVEDWTQYKHVIIDSGLFTLMWGAAAGVTMDDAFAQTWLDKYVRYLNATTFGDASFVELDVQKKMGTDAAWELRRQLKRRVRKGRIINVYHLEDENPDKLIAFSEYIAISLPELRFNVSVRERERIVTYIAHKAHLKGKRVHLLGCTERKYLRAFNFCDTCDSTSWTYGLRYDNLRTRAYGRMPLEVMAANKLDMKNKDAAIYWSAVAALTDYTNAAGSQR